MKYFLLLILSALLVFTNSCKSESKKSAKDVLKDLSNSKNVNVGNQNYKINVPEGWTRNDTSLHGVKFFFLFAPLQPSENFRTNISIVNESMQGLSFDEYKKKSLEYMQTMQGVSILQKGEIEASNMQGTWLLSSMVQSGIKMNVISYLFPKDGIAYVVTGTTKDGYMDKYRATFDNVAKSFNLND